MMTFEEIQAIVALCSCQDFEFLVRLDDDRPYLQVEYLEADISSGEDETQRSRKWFLSPYMTKSEIVQTCLKACLTSVEHRVREDFKYKLGPHSKPRAIFSPHWSVDFLYSNASKAENKDMRAAQWVS